MEYKMSHDDIAVMIRSRQISRQTGLSPAADIKTICEYAGISRKTGYQWTDSFFGDSEEKTRSLERENEILKAENKRLEKELVDVRFENEGRRLAWEVHKVDELITGKKNSTHNLKRRKQ